MAASPVPRRQVAASLGTLTVSSATSVIPTSTWNWPAGAFYDRATAIRVPTLARARNIHVNVVSVLPMRYWLRTPVVDSAGEEQPDKRLEPLEWMLRPDPNEAPSYTLGWTTDDLFWHGHAFWRVRERFRMGARDGFPRSFQRMPYTEVRATYSDDLMSLQSVEWRGQRIPMEDVVEFRGIICGVLEVGSDVIATALMVERARQKFANFNLPPGTLAFALPEGYEPHTVEELNAIGDNWDARRMTGSTAVMELPPGSPGYDNPQWDAEKMALAGNAQQSALDCSRIASVPPWVVGAPNPDGMTYSNAGWSRRDLVDFGSAGFMTTIVQTLSGPNVIPPGTYLDFDLEGWIALANDLGVAVPEKPVQP